MSGVDPAGRWLLSVRELLAQPAYLLVHDPDGRPGPLRRTDDY